MNELICDPKLIELKANQDRDTIESLVDYYGLENVLQLLGEVCSAKSDHILDNWQDEKLAYFLDIATSNILQAAFNVKNYNELLPPKS
tara:strand:- start:6275 stop:6538 length:264 start_codon:yes stop_codon:yes gene_type:complete